MKLELGLREDNAERKQKSELGNKETKQKGVKEKEGNYGKKKITSSISGFPDEFALPLSCCGPWEFFLNCGLRLWDS